MTAEVSYNVGDITLSELKKVVKKFKRRKSSGPDEVPMEIFKEMNDESMRRVLDTLNQYGGNRKK